MVEVARDEAEAGRREGVTRSSTVLEVGLCAGAHWGAMAGFRVRGGCTGEPWQASALLLRAGSLIASPQHPGSCFYPERLQGPKSPPSRPARSTPNPRGGLSPGLCRPRPHPPSPPPRWRSCWHWTRSGRSPSALLLSGLQSPLCHRQRPIRPHPRRTPPGPRASPGPGRPVRIQPNTLGVALQLPRPRRLLSPLSFLKRGSDHVPPLLKTLS